MEWKQRLEGKGVTFVDVPFGLSVAPKPTDEDIKRTLQDLTPQPMILPTAYLSYCKEMGAGTLGRVKIYIPNDNYHMIDMSFQVKRIQSIIGTASYANQVPWKSKLTLSNLIVFAKDVEEDMWFAFYVNEGVCDQQVYILQDDIEANPPKKISPDFETFIEEVAIGTRMNESAYHRAYAVREVPQQADGEEDFLLDQSHLREDEERPPNLRFRPASMNPLMMTSA